MFTVEESPRGGVKRILLQDTQAKTSAELTPSRGGMLTSLRRGDMEYLYIDPVNLDNTQERPRCAVPVLFPCCGRMENGVYRAKGREYPMGIHGVAHTSAFQTAAQYSGGEAACTLILTSNEETRRSYPYDFEVLLRYSLTGGRLCIRQEYRNAGNGPMPFSYGFHPYFRVTKLENARVAVRAAQRVNPSTGAAEPFGEGEVSLPVTPAESGALFTGAADAAVLSDTGDGRRVRIAFDSSFQILMLWSICEKGFICIEPWNGVPDGLNTGSHLTLAPGAAHRAEISLEILS